MAILRLTEHKKTTVYMVVSILVVVLIRIAINTWLYRLGYYYGIPWDSFSRTLISFNWSHSPFFALSDGYWLPLQFWLVGSVFAALTAWVPQSDILVPVIVNHLFFVGSLGVVYQFTNQVTKKPFVAFTACLLMGIFAGDVFVTYSGLSEPILIFFILSASYGFFRIITGNESEKLRITLLTACIVFLAAATHYIGWFLALFFCFYLANQLFRSILRKDGKASLFHLAAIGLCVLFPLIWLLNSYVLFGDPFYPTQVARQAQAAFIGQMPAVRRMLVTPWVILSEFYPLTIPGLICLTALVFKRSRLLLFVIPTGFVLGMIWLSTALAFSAPYQEPRYLVFVCWVLVPLVAVYGYMLWNRGSLGWKVLISLSLVAYLLLNLRQISEFQNSFGTDVQTVSRLSREWLSIDPGQARIILHADSFAETGVIPVMSGYPYQVTVLTEEEAFAQYLDPSQVTSTTTRWMGVTKNDNLAIRAGEEDFRIEKVGEYYLIFPDL